ncbi:MAG: hypothetical protein ACYDH9_20930 [Limisphaerales bacterium]
MDDWIFREADRREDTWQFLLGVRDLTPAAKDLFHAAQSVANALRKLENMLWGGATLWGNLTLIEKVTEQEQLGNMPIGGGHAEKVMRRFVKYGLAKDLRPMPPECRKVIETWKSKAKASAKRHGVKEPQELLTPEQCVPLEAELMMYNWLRWPSMTAEDGVPGLCFYSDQALADLLVFIMNDVKRYGLGTRTVYYQKLRQRLRLLQAYHRKPLVTGVRRDALYRSHGLLQIEVRWKEKTEWHRLFPNQTLRVGGRQVYPVSVPT